MPVRIEFNHVQHPFKLCTQCNENLGCECITLDPGNPRSKKVYSCRECFGQLLKELGEGLMRLIEWEEKGDPNE